ncbi:hypothetical protein BDN70DRAFT_822370 [Pholiota conissans]|uniref:Uncharacterized protein n=1 Tax=Pholiota conissans TaxID=109636 RepID=A0A9P5ZHM1_9AGAR|nr:hypothetical protein BDN70DRAFT_822370 [Pholiota conissans]
MSTWNLGIDDVSEETRAFKDKIASKDSQIAAQQDKIAKQAADYDELKERLNEALQKLTTETQRAIQLELNLKERTEDLRNERISSDNAKSALTAALEKNKSSNLELRQMEATLERISNSSDGHNTRSQKLEREKATLEARVKELESALRQFAPPLPPTTPGRRAISRPRSSSLTNFKITTLEQDLTDARALISVKETELASLNQRLSQLQGDLMKDDNDRMAAERKLSKEIEELKTKLEEKDEELEYFKDQQGDGRREEELLARIEEDEAKISALETMLRGAEDVQPLKEKIRRVEGHLKEERSRLAAAEKQKFQFAQEKIEVLDELEASRRELHKLMKELNDRKARDHAFGQKAAKTLETCEDPLMNDNSCLIDMDTLEPEAISLPPSPRRETDADTLTHIERLLAAVERLRGERDNLRRDVQFLESESRFAIEALEAKLSASMSTESNNATLATIDQLRAEMDEMHAQMLAVGEQYQANTDAKNLEIKRLSIQVQGLAIALGHAATNPAAAAGSPEGLEALIAERDQLLNELEAKEAHWEAQVDNARMGDYESRERLDEAMCEINELNEHLEELESERDSLALQVTNLVTDLQVAQDELTNAETRYTNLQFHQLNTMTSNEATRTLREHIEELEDRVMRRTEQIGIHQHDIRRLETNLRLQEERLSEMTSELEMMGAQKDAMVEDCADARETRDEALARVEILEEEIESVENRSNENKALVTTLIAVIADTVSRARRAIQQARSQASNLQRSLSDVQGQESAIRIELDEKTTDLTTLNLQSAEQRMELEKVQQALDKYQVEAEEFSTLSRTLQDEKIALEVELSALQRRNSDLEAAQAQLPETTADGQKSPQETVNESEVAQLKLEHAQALSALQARLDETESALKDLEARYDSSEEDRQRLAKDAKASIDELEQHLESTNKTLSELQALHDQAVAQEKEQMGKIAELEKSLASSEKAHQDALEAHETLEAETTRLTQELERIQQEQAAVLDSSRDKYESTKQELERKVQSLQGRFEEETRLLDISKEEIARLNVRLEEEKEGRAEDKKAHIATLASANERVEAAEQTISQLQEELAVLDGKLKEVHEQLVAAEGEKTVLQEEITAHEAEVQKTLSMNRYLESQIKDSDTLAATLKADIERLRENLARSEKACKAAEVNLSLQNAQHKRETAEFQRELKALQVRPNLEQALANLEERNNEMEELLRAKCTEIEENDDRVLEMLKEKKKLTTKVESLNRKVQNLQAKLAAAKASSVASAASAASPSVTSPPPVPPLPAMVVPPSKVTSPSMNLISQTPQSISTNYSRPRSATASATPQPIASSSVTPPLKRKSSERDRVASVPSSLPRPKTPERSRAITPVFKARTPEQRHVPEVLDSMESIVVIGKKRSAPDDFEVCENVPAQAFTADGEDVENKTPRVRRVLNSLQTGFTPLRNQNSRPTASMPSPRRTAPPRTTPFISDMTNTPNAIPAMPSSSSKQAGKRSWLGKIRGSSTERAYNSRNLFDRGESS